MRRNEVDAGSQPVRNLATNPAFLTTAGNNALRSNLVLNPRAEYATGLTHGVARTNLCINPRGVNGFSGYGEQNVTANVAISDHPEGFTTANRVSYVGGAANPGVVLINPVVSGNTYAVSAWVYHETIPAAGTQAFAQSGVTSSTAIPFVQGVWQRHTWTYTATGTSQLGFRVSSQTTDGSFLITGVMVELSRSQDSYFDGVTRPALRTNLALNPQANSGTSWGTMGTAAGSTSFGNTEQALNGSASIKRTLTAAGNTGFKALVRGGFVEGDTLSWSLWVRPTVRDMTFHAYWERSTPYTGGTAGAAVLCPVNQWTEVTGTLTMTATQVAGTTFGFGALCTSAVAGDIYHVDMALVEKSATLGTYFDGASVSNSVTAYGWRGNANDSASYAYDPELTPGWSGSGDNSTSRLYVPNVENWAQAVNAGIYRTANQGAPIGSYAAAVVTRGFSGDGIYLGDITITAGMSYTSSAWIKITDTIPTMSSVMRYKDAGGTILTDLGGTIHTSLVVGQWVRVSTTSVAPTNATKLQQMWRIYSSSYTPTTFYVSGAMVEATPVLGDYFDGSTPAAGDFTYGWNGSINRATSTQWAPNVAGSITTKSTSGAAIDSKFQHYQTTFEDGAKGVRYVAPAGTPNSTWRIAGLSTGGWDFNQIKAGGRYTLWFRWRAKGWPTQVSTTPVQISTGGSNNHVVGSFTATNLPPLNDTVGWQEYRRTFTALRDADVSQWIYISLPVTPSATTDGVFEIRDWGLYEGTYTGDPIDGSKPLAKWEGAANASTSIGYPPQLLDIAGAPMAALYTEGTTLAPISGGAFDDCTVYLAYEAYAEVAEWTSIASIGGWNGGSADYSTKGAFTYGRRNGGNLWTSHTRVGTLANSNQSGLGSAVPGPIQGYKPSRHVVAIQLTDGVNNIRHVLDGGTEYAVAIQPGNGIAREAIKMRTGVSNTDGTASTAAKGLALLYYPGRHSAATRTAMLRYLGNKYGAAVA